MTEYRYFIHAGDKGLHLVVTRLKDGIVKTFFQTNKNEKGLSDFMASMTDELIESYFPKPGKKGRSDVDNLAYLHDIERHVAVARSFVLQSIKDNAAIAMADLGLKYGKTNN